MEPPSESPNTEEPRPREENPSADPPSPSNAGKAGPEDGEDRGIGTESTRTSASPAENKSHDDAIDAHEGAKEDKPETSLRNESLNLDMILDIPLEITVELGRTQMPINELLQLGPGAAVPLSKLEGEPVDILANDRLIAKGIVLVKDEKYGIQITEITGRLKRLRGLQR